VSAGYTQDAVFDALRLFLSGGDCPTPGCRGECSIAGVDLILDNGDALMTAELSIWDPSFNDAAMIADLVRAASGGCEVSVTHTLYCDLNDVRDGRHDLDGARFWRVHWYEPCLSVCHPWELEVDDHHLL